jgi:hypothetical protein
MLTSLSLFMHVGPLSLTLHGDADTSYFDFFSPEDALEPMPRFDSDTNKGKRGRKDRDRDRDGDRDQDQDQDRDNENEDLTSFSFSNF